MPDDFVIHTDFDPVTPGRVAIETPVRQDQTGAFALFSGTDMASGAMGMAVNHDGCAGLPEEIGDDGGVDVHDVGRLLSLAFLLS